MTTNTCIICNKEYEVYDSNKAGKIKGGTRKVKLKRGRNTICCSPKCSWIYSGFQPKERKEIKELHNTRQKGGKIK